MDLANRSEIKNLLKKYNIKPEKRFGQHFILSKKTLGLMIMAAKINPKETIIEIGPGLGTLTEKLAETGANIIAIEKDRRMVEILKETLVNYKNIKIIHADARQFIRSPTSDKLGISMGKNGYKIVANLPYSAATFLIRKWLESKNPPELMVLMIQKEVARRICAAPPKSNLLSISVRFYAEPKIIGYASKEMFWPRPKVNAAIIKIVPKRNEENDYYQSIASKQSFAFFKIVKAGFSQPRKQLIGNLSSKLKLPKEKLIKIFRNLNISSITRAENLSLDEWQKLVFELIHN